MVRFVPESYVQKANVLVSNQVNIWKIIVEIACLILYSFLNLFFILKERKKEISNLEDRQISIDVFVDDKT